MYLADLFSIGVGLLESMFPCASGGKIMASVIGRPLDHDQLRGNRRVIYFVSTAGSVDA